MTQQERELIWFDELVRDREENARILSKDSMTGYRQSPIDKYSDRAHFVYEFLQNADDVKASKCKFTLSRDRLLFEHNGTIPFKVSNPRTEGMDRRSGKLGGVNAITAAGLSTKSGNEIGRFGIGFKAVFQYTDEPKIYDDNIFFGLKDEIVPYLIGNDLSGRKFGETCFDIPFRRAEKDRAYSDIKEKIESIMHPLLFLSNLKEISFEAPDVGGQYSKEVCDHESYREEKGDEYIDVEFMILKSRFGDKETRTKVLKFSEDTEDGRISVVFGINNNNGTIGLDPLPGPVFCFFPTKKETGLNFLVHGPFLLNDSREGIKEGNEHNIKLIANLARLAVTAIDLLESRIPLEMHNWFGKRVSGIKIVDDGILDYVPLNLKDKQDEISLKAFVLVFKAVFTTQALIPCQDGDKRELVYRKKENACWSSDGGLINLFTPKQLGALLGMPNVCWGFASVNGSTVSNEKENFIKECCANIVSWSSIKLKLTADFLERQPIAWFEKLFDYIVQNNPWNLDPYKTLPMFLDGAGKAVPAFDADGNHVLYLPGEVASTSKTIHPELLRFASVKRIVNQWKIKKESGLAVVNRIVREDLVNGDESVYVKGLLKVLEFCDSCSDEELQKVGAEFKNNPALIVNDASSCERWRVKSDDCYYPTDDLLLYFKGCEKVPFVDVAYLNEIVGAENSTVLEKLLSVLEIRNIPKIFTVMQCSDVNSLYGETREWHYSYKKPYEKWNDLYLDHIKEFYESFLAEQDIGLKRKMSDLGWRFICQTIGQVVSGHEHIEDKMKGVHRYYYDYAWRTEEYETILHDLVKNTIWLFDRQGVLRGNGELFVETLSEMYDVHSAPARQLLELLGIKHDERLRALNTLSDDERQDLKAAKDFRDAGLGSMVEAKSILGNIPAEVRQKICSGTLTAEKILKAVDLLERAEADGRGATAVPQDRCSIVEQSDNTTTGDIITALSSDEHVGGLAVAEQHDVLVEAKKMVRNALESEGYEFTEGICEKECSVINGVKKGGIEYPLVVHSYIDRARPFQLNAADWAQLMKPNSMLMVRTGEGVCPVPFKNLVCNRDKIDFSISTKDNLEMSDRIASLAHVLRWFKGLRFDFGSLIPVKAGTAQLFDLPENPMTDEQRNSQMTPDSVEGVL